MTNRPSAAFRGLVTMVATLPLFLSISSVAQAVPVYYSVTLDTVLNNPNGTWGGNLLIGANQNLNLTISFQFESAPRLLSPTSSGIEATFRLLGLQVVDNTHGFASDAFRIRGGSTRIRYDGTNDRFSGSSAGFSPSGAVYILAIGEFGDPGDALPSGAAFDGLVNAAGLSNLSARAPDWFNDNLHGLEGTGPLVPGTYTFASSALAASK